MMMGEYGTIGDQSGWFWITPQQMHFGPQEMSKIL